MILFIFIRFNNNILSCSSLNMVYRESEDSHANKDDTQYALTSVGGVPNYIVLPFKRLTQVWARV